jgi:hypothetical protein
MRLSYCLIVLLVLSSACSPLTTAEPDSGIEGTVTIGPTCPVVQVGNPCLDKPYQATLTVLTSAGVKLLQFQTGADGHYRITLAPGDYILHPESPQMMPHAPDIPFAVVAHQFTRVDVVYDSGIR